MKKIFVLIFLILILSIKSCASAEKQVIFIRGDKLNAIGEISFLNVIKDSNVNFKEIILKNEEEFSNYVEANLNSKSGKDKLFIVSSIFSNVLLNESYSNLVYINGNKDDVVDFRIDQRCVSYIFGVISGMLTRTNEISIVYSDDMQDSFDNVLAFILGVKNVNPRAYDMLKSYENVLDIDSLGEVENIVSAIIDFMDSNNSDIVFYLDNEFLNNVYDIFEDNMKSIVTLERFGENIFLNIKYKYDEVIEDVFKGRTKTYFISLVGGLINIDLKNLPEDVRDVTQNSLSEVFNNSIIFPTSMKELIRY